MSKELLITGLRNAHAMENQAHEMLERQVERMGDYPELRARLQEHLAETKTQMKRLEQCLGKLDSDTSTLKDMTMSLGANIAAMGHAMASDEVLKNTFANGGLEAYEIATYKSLIKMAESAEPSLIGTLKQSLAEEEKMADWVEQNVERITAQYMAREAKAAA